jgi:hypothetical protein
MDYTLHTYMQPHASHIVHPERLLMQDMQGAWYLWFGDDQGPIAVGHELARWILERPEMIRMHAPLHWFDLESLPLKVGTYDNERSVAD